MSGFEYPKDYYDPEPYPEKEEQAPTPTSYLERDMAAYAQHMDTLSRGVMPGEPDPALGLRKTTNTGDNPLEVYRLTFQVMRGHGYKTYEYAIARKPDGEIAPNSIAQYVSPDDAQAVRRIMDLLHEDSYRHHKTFSAMHFKMTNSIIASAEILNPELAAETRKQLIPSDYEADAESLMERAFLTSQVFLHIRQMRTSAELGIPTFVSDKQTLATYETLRERGVRPFGVEELIGMASSAVNYILRHNDIPAPADQEEY